MTQLKALNKKLKQSQMAKNKVKAKASAQQPGIQLNQSGTAQSTSSKIDPKYLEVLKKSRQLYKSHPKQAMSYLEEQVKNYPDQAELLLMYSESQNNQGMQKQARETAKQCLALKKMPMSTALSLSRLMTTLGMEKDAIRVAKNVYLNNGEPLALATKVLLTATSTCEWDLVEKITGQLLKHYQSDAWKSTVETPRTHLLWCADEAINNRVFQYFATSLYPKWSGDKPLPLQLNGRKIKIGYMSSDYRNHPTAQLIKGLIREHDKEKFQIIAYDTGYDDKSAMRKETLDLFDRVEVLNEKNDDEAIEILKRDQVDVVIELNGLTASSRMGILASHPVPVQIAYLGFPGSVGGRFMDYVIADSYVIPKEHEKYYAEKILRIEKTYQANDHVKEKWPEKVHKRTFGFADDVLVLGMFNNANKVTDLVWKTWMDILQRLPHAVLWMLKPNEAAQENLVNGALKHNINPNRIIFAPRLGRESHFQRVAACDLILDPWPYGGHTTTSDSLFAGVPVVTLKGTNFASRVSSGLIIAAGLPGLVAENIEEYIDGVVRLSNTPGLLEKAKHYLIENRDKLNIFDSQSKARQLEQAVMTILERRIQGLPDVHINMTPVNSPNVV
jgi:predicted O-linked N-acetylglucosamine transferase (SPINDLY family)